MNKKTPDKMHDIMKRMKTRREELNMSYQTLSEKVGISKSTLQRYETGYIKNMPVDKLEEIANALEISPLYLMGWENKATTPSKDSYELLLINEASKLNPKGKIKLLNTIQEMLCSPLYNNNYLQAITFYEQEQN
ncbi:helix-turn-helix domain-containing protein [Blautia stercoris]